MLSLDLSNLVKYALEGLAVAVAAFYIPRRNLNAKDIVLIALTAAATFAVLVAYWPTMRPVPVARYSYTQYARPRSPARNVEWTEQMRQWWRDGAAEQKRDERGRFAR
jgi:hypothetical protein